MNKKILDNIFSLSVLFDTWELIEAFVHTFRSLKQCSEEYIGMEKI